MRYIPVYQTPDGSLTLAPNGSYPMPLHLTSPRRAFDFAMALGGAGRRSLGLAFETLDGEGRFTVLTADGETVCGSMCLSETPRYLSARMVGMMSAMFCEPAAEAFTSEENRARFTALIPQALALVPELDDAAARVILPEENLGCGEIRLAARRQAAFDSDGRKILAGLILNCDDFLAEAGAEPETVELRFLIHGCMDEERWAEEAREEGAR